jgi:CRP-like cAMP-binding protein
MNKALETNRRTGNLLWDALVQEHPSLPFRGVSFSLGQTLYEADAPVTFVYFPTSCVVSCLYTTRKGATAETALVGNDGVLGVAVFLADGKSPYRAVAEIGGYALRIPANAARAAFTQGGLFQRVLLRYTDALIMQISQTAICNRLHPLEQRLCRWLLLCHDRVHGSEFLMTQESIASMLGGRRESVTVAAGHLQDLGLISYSRGRIKIVNRAEMERMVCECYETVNSRTGSNSGHTVIAPRKNSAKEADGETLLIG